MEFILAAGILETLLLLLLLVSKKNKELHDKFLIGYLALIGLTLLLSIGEIYNRQHAYPFPFLISASTPLILLHGPVLWFYIYSLTKPNFTFRRFHLLHLLPFTGVLLILVKQVYLLPVDVKIDLEITESFKKMWAYPVVMLCIAISTQAYLIWGIFMIRNHQKNIKHIYAETQKLDLSWLKSLLICSIICYASISAIYLTDYSIQLLPYGSMQIVGFSIAALYIFFLGFFGLRQGKVFVNYPNEKVSDKDSNENIPEDLNRAYTNEVKRLLAFMDENKPFLEPSINLTSLSRLLNMNADNLSNILNTQLNMNFFDFINHYRIQEFKVLVKKADLKKHTIIGIAWDCGFNSKATFNRQFKNSTGLTPTQFVKKVSSK
ncbi:MAG: AraC family transcriptional regulator [Bacteroidales bacterium]|nr:AraC family transcriptional regulator [Bacteroidales bacterium]